MQANSRGQRVAIGALVLQAVLIALGVWLYTTHSAAAAAALWMLMAPTPIWLLTLILFYCRFLQRREEIELEELAAKGARESIFDEGERDELRTAAARVRWLERWIVPIFTLLMAGYHLGIGAMLLRWVHAAPAVTIINPAAGFFVALGGAFLALLLSRYAIGMAKVSVWAPLRAPASYLCTNALVMLLLAAVMAAAYFKTTVPGAIVAHILPAFMLVIGAELMLNFVLDLYRPRVPGAERRFSYDSRLLNLIASPESIAHSIAEAVNYQFGFEVSSTWFYKLLQKTLAPLLLCGAVILWLLTSVVVVDEGQTYLRLHLGEPVELLKPRPRPHVIWPWPIDTTRKFDTGGIHKITLGVGAERGHADRQEGFVQAHGRTKRVSLWTSTHGAHEELNILVAVPPSAERTPWQGAKPPADKGAAREEAETPSVMVVKLVVNVHYTIAHDTMADVLKFDNTAADAPTLLESLASREMVRYAASATLDEELPVGEGQTRPQGLMSFGRADAAVELKKRIAAAASELDLGVKIVHVELVGCHPPSEAAEAFEKVIAAAGEREGLRYEAQKEANKMLADAAGSPETALRLAQQLHFIQHLKGIATLHRNKSDLSGGLRKALEWARSREKDLLEEERQERLLGKLTAGRRTVAQQLRENQKGFIAFLEGVQATPSAYLHAPDKPAPDKLSEQIAGYRSAADDLFAAAEGQAAVMVARAWAYRWKIELDRKALADTFGVALAADKAASNLYRLSKYLAVRSEAIRNKRKYVIGMDRNRVEVRLNAETQGRTITDIPIGPNNK